MGNRRDQPRRMLAGRQQLSDTCANTNAVQLLDTGTFTDPPSAADLMAVANKLNELIQAMRR